MRNEQDFAKHIRQFRFGALGNNDTYGNAYPLVYSSAPSDPVMYKTDYFPATSVHTVPGQKWEMEFWAIIVVYQATPEATQKLLFELGHQAQIILSQNVQLRDKDREDPLCHTSSTILQRRLETQRGKLTEAMNVRVRTINYTMPFDLK